MVWADSGGRVRRGPSQAVSPWFAQSVCPTDVLNPRMGKATDLFGNRVDGVCMWDGWIRLEWCGSSDTGWSVGKFDASSEGSVEIFVHVSTNLFVSPLAPKRLGSDDRCAQQGNSIPIDVGVNDQRSTEQRPWESFTDVRGANKSHERLMEQLDGAGKIVARIGRRIGTIIAATYCRVYDVLLFHWRQRFQSISAFE